MLISASIKMRTVLNNKPFDLNEKAFQQDAYREFVDQEVVLSGVGAVQGVVLCRGYIMNFKSLQGECCPVGGECCPEGCYPGNDIITPSPCGQTNASENITLLQTSFAGGKYVGKTLFSDRLTQMFKHSDLLFI